jgi:hypothetical protein
MEFPRWVTLIIGGQLVYVCVAEGMHVEKAKEPHIPEVVYATASTKDLTYFVSGTTAGTLAISGDRRGEYLFKMPDGGTTTYKII